MKYNTFRKILFHPFSLQRHIKKSVFISFILSYIAILLIPLICSTGIFFSIRKNVQKEMLQTNRAILTQTSQVIDSAIESVSSVCLDLSLKENIASILYIQPPFDTIQRYNISEVIRRDMKNAASQLFINNYCIYFNRGQFVLTPSASYTPELAYQAYFAQSAFNFNEWTALMQARHYHNIYDLDDSLLYLQTIPYSGTEAVATIAVTLNKALILNQIDQIEWASRGMFFAVDSDGQVILTNRKPEDFADLNLTGKAGQTLTGTFAGKQVFASQQITEENGWSYYLVMDNGYLNTSNQTLNGIFWVYLLGTVFLGVMMALLFSKRNYLPIKDMIHTLKNGPLMPDNQNELMFIDASVKRMLHLNADIQRQLDMKEDLVRQNFLSRMLRGRINPSYLDETTLRGNNLFFEQSNFLVAIFKVDDCSGYFAGMQADDEEYPLDSMDYSLILLLRELICEKYLGYVCEVNGLIACVINFADDEQPGVLETIQNARTFVAQMLYILMTLAVSGTHRSLVGIHKAYDEASLAMDNSIFNSTDSIFFYSADSAPSSYCYSVEIEQSLTGNLRAGNSNQVKEILQEIFRTNLEENKTSLDLFRCFLFDIAATFIRVIEGMDLQSEELSTNQIAAHIGSLRSVEQMQSYLLQTAEEICCAANDGKESHNTVLLNRILEYLWQNYANGNLNNEQIAQAMGISPAYLSRFFKQQTGDGLLSYLNRIRIEEAKKLLSAKGRPPLGKICQTVGFDNVATFIRIFKKFEGITPGKYAELE